MDADSRSLLLFVSAIRCKQVGCEFVSLIFLFGKHISATVGIRGRAARWFGARQSKLGSFRHFLHVSIFISRYYWCAIAWVCSVIFGLIATILGLFPQNAFGTPLAARLPQSELGSFRQICAIVMRWVRSAKKHLMPVLPGAAARLGARLNSSTVMNSIWGVAEGKAYEFIELKTLGKC